MERWHGIELRHLLALDAVAREGSFRGASARLGYVPSAVSQQIAALEKIVGERLIDRSRGSRTVGLTAAGELVLRHAEPIIARVQAAQADLASLAEGAAGTLRVGITQSVGVRILPSLMHRFAPAWPGIELRPSEAESDIALYDLLERGDLELAFVELPAPPGPFETTQLYVDPYVLVVPADHPLARLGRTPSLAEIAGLKLVGHTQCRGLRRVEAQLRARGAEVEFVFRSDVNATVQSLVAAGIGAAIVPALAVDLGDRRTVAFDLSRHVPPRTLALAWHRDRQRSPAALAFSDAAHAVCAQLATPEATVRAV